MLKSLDMANKSDFLILKFLKSFWKSSWMLHYVKRGNSVSAWPFYHEWLL